ncbi:MAG: UPF0164 family protein [candidate division WOR-3 bacterium]|jgi:hypothetical protein
MQTSGRGLLLLLLLIIPGYAIFEDSESGPRAEGMGGSFTAVADDIGAVDFNPAGLALISEKQFLGFYKLLYGGVGVNLHTIQAGAGVPVRNLGAIALRFQETGFKLQSQRSLKLAHGFQIAEGLMFGYGINGYSLYQQNFGAGFALGVDLSLLARFARFWSAGFYARNVNMPRIGSSELPQRLVFGIGFSPRPGIQSAVQVAKEPGIRTQFAFGQEFEVVADYLSLRAGVETEPVRFSFGVGTGFRKVGVDYALITHPVLPFSHNFGVRVRF